MSKRRSSGDVVMKKSNAGFVGKPGPIRLVAEDDRMACNLCEDLDCCEWANCEMLDDQASVTIGYAYHVSECQMDDLV